MVSRPLDDLIAEIGRVSEPETLTWLEGEVERWSEWAASMRARGQDCGWIDQIVHAVSERRAELRGGRDRPRRGLRPEAARRALEVAAAGGHSLLLVGPSGACKTMLARCMPGLLPAGDDPAAPRPVRVPGLTLTPKLVAREFALAAGGTLILDDLPALRPATLRALAEALDGDHPHVQLVATMRPCPCGHLGDYRTDCGCTPDRSAAGGRGSAPR